MTSSIRVAILTESGSLVGLGHIARCVALYDAFEMLGSDCRLIVSGEVSASVVGSRRFEIRDWQEPAAAVECVKNTDIAIVDSYVADLCVYEAIAARVSTCVYIDDIARLSYPRGIVVNGNPEGEQLGFRVGPETQLLLGTRFQLLRSEFRNTPERETRECVGRVLVVSSGADAGGIRNLMGNTAHNEFPDAQIDVVDAPRSAEQMRESMMLADLAVSAGGQTLYELAATGTPTVAVCIADNQVPQTQAFERARTLLLAGEWSMPDISDRLATTMSSLAPREARHEMKVRARELVDGMGAERVSEACLRVHDAPPKGARVLLLAQPHPQIEACIRAFGDIVVRTEAPLAPNESLLREADYIVSYGYRHLIPADILEMFGERAINLHISMLPWNRGADPNLWSFLENTPKGVTIHVLDPGLDAGPIIAQLEVFSEEGDTLASSYTRLRASVESLFCSTWPDIRHGRVAAVAQSSFGSYHCSADKARFAHLLRAQWDTPVAEIEGKASS